MSLDPSAPPSAPHSNDSTSVVIATGPAVPEQTDPSEVVVKKPMPLPTGTQAMDILNCVHNYYIIVFKPAACQLKVGAPGFLLVLSTTLFLCVPLKAINN